MNLIKILITGFDRPVTNAVGLKFHFPYNKKNMLNELIFLATAWDKFTISDWFSIFILFTDDFKT